MKTLTLNIPALARESRIFVGCGIINSLRTLLLPERYSRVVLVTDAGAASRWGDLIASNLEIAPERILKINSAESRKSVEGAEEVWNFFFQSKLDRKSLVINLGGGALLDLAGFCASTYQRGIAFVNIPSTLLGQVDASIGGKSGINFNGAKNVIGAINQPEAVVVDIELLATLPERELTAGFAEILKHGLIADAEYFRQVSSKKPGDWSKEELEGIVLRSIEIKHQIVESDELEQGPRKMLNFGHTFGHAFESLFIDTNSRLLHGEAVSIGMVAEACIAQLMGDLSKENLDEITIGIGKAGLPISLPSPLPIERVMPLILQDKKNSGGRIKWSLLKRIGSGTFNIEVNDEIIKEALIYVSGQHREI